MKPEALEQLARRMLVDLLLEADEQYWLRRADTFAQVGTSACDQIAQACRIKAALCRSEHAGEWAEMLAAELAGAA